MKYLTFILGGLLALGSVLAQASDPIDLRMESFLVAPSHTPSAVLVVRNRQSESSWGTFHIAGPEGWEFEPTERSAHFAPGATQRLRFLVRRAVPNNQTLFPLTITANTADRKWEETLSVRVTSAPYFKPTIDGNISDWKDAIPVEWKTRGKKSVIRTYWNRRRFSVLVEVEEEQLLPPENDDVENDDVEKNTLVRDAIQIALSPENARTGVKGEQPTVRFEFLIAGSETPGKGVCYQLAQPRLPLAACQQERSWSSMVYEEAEVAVVREGNITRYEFSLPFRPMREQIRPSEGRAFCFSVLIHDPDGTGIRDWGAAAGLWPDERGRLAWSNWRGAKWGPEPPFDNKTPWGLCSSKY